MVIDKENFNGKWNPETKSYLDACVRLSKDLSNFKRDKDYIRYVGNDIRPESTVVAFDNFVSLPYVSKNDKIGNPILHNGKSAATLRFAKVVQDIDNTSIIYKHVLEIGGGYGGQCLVMKELKNVDYTIIDIPEALELSKAYLSANNVDCNFIKSTEVPNIIETDLLISDYCLSEFDELGIDFYLDRINFDLGYFTLNGQVDYISKKINRMGYRVILFREEPATSRHENYILIAIKDQIGIEDDEY